MEHNSFVLQPFTNSETQITTLWLEVKSEGAVPGIKTKSIWFEILFDDNGFFYSGWTWSSPSLPKDSIEGTFLLIEDFADIPFFNFPHPLPST